MKRAILMRCVVALALLLCFSNADDSDDSDRGRAARRSKDDSDDSGTDQGDFRRSKAFLSRRESAEVVRHQKKNYGRLYNIVAAPAPAPALTRSPLEPYREVCETNLACDELADQIGFKAAYRRFYGPIRFY